MTAIALVRTTVGIVIGADGRRITCHSNGNAPDVDDEVQKVFQLTSRNIAYAWTGAVAAPSSESSLGGFDLHTISSEAAASLTDSAFSDFAAFAGEFCEGIYERIPQDTIKALYRQPRADAEPCALLVLIGHPDNRWNYITARYEFSAEGASRPELKPICPFLEDQLCVVSGSSIILSAMRDCGAAHAPTLDDGVRVIRRYIEACIASNEPECSCIGGRVHIAVLDSCGFRWDTPPAEVYAGPGH